MILIDGDPLEDIAILQNTKKIHVIVINGHIHKHDESGEKVVRIPPVADAPLASRTPAGEKELNPTEPVDGPKGNAVNGATNGVAAH